MITQELILTTEIPNISHPQSTSHHRHHTTKTQQAPPLDVGHFLVMPIVGKEVVEKMACNVQAVIKHMHETMRAHQSRKQARMHTRLHAHTHT